MNKKVILISIAVIALIVVLIVGFIGFRVVNAIFFSQIKDINGDSNKELATITDAEIEDTVYDSSALLSNVSFDGRRSGVNDEFSDWDYEISKVSVFKLSGIYLANSYKGDGKEVTYEIKSEVTSGNFKIVITDETHKILYAVPIDSVENITFIAEENKLYLVKLVGESAQINVEINRTTID